VGQNVNRFAALAAAALLATALSGCGGGGSNSSSGSYCDDLAAAKASYIGLTENSISQATFNTLLQELHTLRDRAPSSVEADWAAFSEAADEFNTALRNDGMTLDDVVKMQNDPHMEAGPKMDTVMAAASALSSLRVARAQGAIAEEALKDCKISLE
jgi:hypothetical protein